MVNTGGGEAKRRRPGRPTADEAGEGETRARIIWAAVELFQQRGYAAVSIGDIAAAVGVTKATLYYHFSGKDAIYTAVMCQSLEAIARGVRQITRLPVPLRDRLYQVAAYPLLELSSDANLDAMMRDAHQHLTPAQRDEIAAAHRDTMGAFEELMRSGIDRGELKPVDPRVLAHAFFHLVEAFRGQLGAETGFRGRPAIVDAVVDLFLYGTAPPAAPNVPAAHN
ncbi:MAG: TetR/AcrR family transcriptional regulator [Chloroflexota bacterium]|nr:TetR/AcrR family transcriptional regulator [Chloroflexota bacterium]